jgi:hypothetical protein
VALATTAATLAMALAAVAPAAAVNVTGTWQAVYHCMSGSCAGQSKPDTFVLTQAPGSSTVTGTGQNGATVSGTLSGNVLTINGKNPNGHTATATVTISADGQSFSGSYQDDKGTSGTISATREGAARTEEAARLASATQVLCNLQVALANFTCAVEVGDASTQSPAKVPTGSVKLTAPSGAFVPLDSCTLVPTPGSPNVSSCSVTYVPPFAGVPTGSAAPVTAAYSGDSVFAGSTGLPGAGAGISPTVSPASPGPGEASTTVSCPAGAQSCPITANLSVVQSGQAVTAKQKRAGRTVTIGSTAVTLSSGQRKTIKVSLNRAGRRLLAGHRHLVALLSVTSGGVLIKTEKVQIKPLRHGG